MDLQHYFPPGSLQAGLLVSLLSVWLLIGLFAYLNHYTRRRYFTLWTVAWLFYAVWLLLNFGEEPVAVSPWLQMSRQWCLGVSAVFLFWGSLVFLGQRVRQMSLGLFIVFFLVWSYVGACYLGDTLNAKLPVSIILGVSSLRAAYCFLRYRQTRPYIGASLMSLGLLLWGVYLGGYPLWEDRIPLRAASFFLCGVIQLFMAVSMIILMLEEARATLNRLVETNRSNREARLGLQNQVRSTEDRYRKLFEQASDGIIITDTGTLSILELNQRAKRLLAITQWEPGKRSLNEFMEDAEAGKGCRHGVDQFQRVRLQRSMHLVATDGTKTPVEAEATAIEFEGQPAYQFAFRELTERVRLEQQLRQSEKLSALGQMISGIAHELNNPLAVIKGYLDLVLTRHEIPDRTRLDLQKVAHESTRAAKLVKNFLSFARERPVHRGPADINQAVERVMDLRQFVFRSANIETRVDLADGLPRVLADADQLQQVLANLVTNAVQALPSRGQGGVLRIRTERANGHVRVLVEDNGPGVAKDLETKIFEPFFTTKEVGKGTGLGLSIAHSIMAEHSGRIYYQPSSLGGACFVLEWPVMEQPPQEAATFCAAAPAFEPAPASQAPHPANILILDDERALAEMLGQIIQHLGYQATLCFSPIEALARLEHEDFDLILSDYRMPGLDGQEFYQRVSALKPRMAARIIFLTGDVVNDETQSFLSSIGNACVTKPFQIQIIESTVTRALQEQTAAIETMQFALN